jgi:hypothetical protein
LRGYFSGARQFPQESAAGQASWGGDLFSDLGELCVQTRGRHDTEHARGNRAEIFEHVRSPAGNVYGRERVGCRTLIVAENFHFAFQNVKHFFAFMRMGHRSTVGRDMHVNEGIGIVGGCPGHDDRVSVKTHSVVRALGWRRYGELASGFWICDLIGHGLMVLR